MNTQIPLKYRFCVDGCPTCHQWTLPQTFADDATGITLQYTCGACYHSWPCWWDAQVAKDNSTWGLITIVRAGIASMNARVGRFCPLRSKSSSRTRKGSSR